MNKTEETFLFSAGLADDALLGAQVTLDALRAVYPCEEITEARRAVRAAQVWLAAAIEARALLEGTR